MSDNLTGQESQALNRDIGQLEALIEELLTYARLDRPQNELKLSVPDLPVWLTTHLEDAKRESWPYGALTSSRNWRLRRVGYAPDGAGLDNLLNNALRYCQSTVQASLLLNGNQATLVVEDDGPGIAPDAREQVLNRLYALTPAVTGQPGLWAWASHRPLNCFGYGGTVVCDESELGGARFTFRWPVWHNIPEISAA